MTRALAALVLFAGCSRPQPTGPEQVWDVSAGHLTRDLPTSQSYAGRMVRVRLDRGTYSVSGRDIHVSGTVPFTPAILVFHCREPQGEGARLSLVVTGRCLPPKRDYIFRTALADFGVEVADCSVILLPDPLGPRP